MEEYEAAHPDEDEDEFEGLTNKVEDALIRPELDFQDASDIFKIIIFNYQNNFKMNCISFYLF